MWGEGLQFLPGNQPDPEVEFQLHILTAHGDNLGEVSYRDGVAIEIS